MPTTTVTPTLIRRCFGLKWPPASVFSSHSTLSNVVVAIFRQRSRSLTTATHTRTSAALIGNGLGRMPFVESDNGGVYGHNFVSLRRYSNTQQQQSNKRFNLRALPFSISPEEALESFRKWAEDEQGLGYLMNYNNVRIGAAYVPVWSFDLNIRFKQQNKLYSWKPPIFRGYGNQDVIHLPGGLAAYAGYSYRRSLINPVHSTTLIFMGDQTEPFGAWMLKDMKLKDTGSPVHVVPDAWNSTQARAFAVVKEELQGIVDADWEDSDTPPPIVQTEVVSSRRVFMPTFVIEYTILGLEYQAFVSGCDTSAPVGGVSHQIFEGGDDIGGLSPEFQRSSRNLLVQLSSGASRLLQTFNLPVLLTIFRPLFSVMWFVLVRIATLTPVIGIFGGLFAGFRKILRPWMDSRKASADWERQRQHEAEMHEDEAHYRMNDFSDVSGRARSHFRRNKEAILQSLSGEQSHQEGDFDWYSDWQAWARQQWEQQARQQQQQQQNYYNQQQQYQRQYQQQYQWQQQQQQQQQRQQSRSSTKKDEFKWPFNENDPYSVLGIERHVSDKEVSSAFRKEMLKYHPDTQPNASEAQKRRSLERSKLITEAYRKIRTERKANKQR